MLLPATLLLIVLTALCLAAPPPPPAAPSNATAAATTGMAALKQWAGPRWQPIYRPPQRRSGITQAIMACGPVARLAQCDAQGRCRWA